MSIVLLDTNPITRCLTQDNPYHAARSRSLFEWAMASGLEAAADPV
jgi:hypothetical protein